MNEKRKGGAGSRQAKCLAMLHVLCAGEDNTRGYRLASDLGLCGKQFKMFPFFLSNTEFSRPMFTVWCFPGC